MALPNANNLFLMGWSFNGKPFVSVAGNGSVETEELGYSFNGTPFVGANGGPTQDAVNKEEDLSISDSDTYAVTVTFEEDLGVDDSTAGASLLVSIEEDLATSDSESFQAMQTAEEDLALDETVFINPTTDSESISISDTDSYSVTITSEEDLSMSDSAVTNFGLRTEEDLSMSDLDVPSITISSSESLSISESFTVTEIDIDLFGIHIGIGEYDVDDFGIKVDASEYNTDEFGVSVPIKIDTLVAVTNATSPDNGFQPTVAVNGSAIYSNPSTAPVTYSNTGVFVSYLSAGITNIKITDMWSWNFQLDYSGGSWALESKIQFGTLGSKVQFFGLNATITEAGEVVKDGVLGYSYRGIFGNPLLNRQVNLIMYGQPSGALIPSQALSIPSADSWTTVMGAALAIASVAGANLAWYVHDAPYTTGLVESGTTGLSALATLAARVGGTLRWDGDNHYAVEYPDRSHGVWIVPDGRILQSSGIEYRQKLDLETGLTGGLYTGAVLLIPVLPQNQAATNTLPANPPNGSGQPPTVQQITKITKQLTKDDPPLVYDLPQDFDQLYIQILVPQGQPTSGLYVTSNAQEWFTFNTSSFNDEYSFMTFLGGRYIPQMKVDYKLFPNNAAVTASHFILSIAASVKSLQTVANQATQEFNDNVRNLLAWQQDSYRFVQTYEGVINSRFFGSLPLPGMQGTASVRVKDALNIVSTKTVSGIIESVSYSYPGNITVQVANYLRLDFFQPFVNFSAQG